MKKIKKAKKVYEWKELGLTKTRGLIQRINCIVSV